MISFISHSISTAIRTPIVYFNNYLILPSIYHDFDLISQTSRTIIQLFNTVHIIGQSSLTSSSG